VWTDPLVVRYIGGHPHSAEEVWSRLLRYAGHWAWLGYGYWAIEQKSTGEFVGEVGFADFRRDLSTRLDGIPEIGWVLAARFHGLGYPTEAIGAIVAWGDQHLESDETYCLISPGNAASIAVSLKFGYSQRCLLEYKGETLIAFQRLFRKRPPVS
jgi:RimJ/RimL family protein N-acetyltransferase